MPHGSALEPPRCPNCSVSALPSPQVAPAHGWRPPSWGCSCPSEGLVVPTGAGGPRAPQSCWDPRAGTWWCPGAGDPSFLMGSSAPPSPALPTANPPVPLGEALLCPKDGQGKEGTGLGAPGMEEGISGEPSSKPRCPGASPGSPCRVAVARGLSQPWDTSPQPPMPAHRGHPAALKPAQGPPRQPRAPPRAGEKEQLTLLPPTRERRCHQTPAFFPFPLGACSS